MFSQQGAAGVGRQWLAEGAQEAVRAVAVVEAGFGVGAGQGGHQFAGVDADAGEVAAVL